MPPAKLKIKLRIEELTPGGQFLIDALTRDQALIVVDYPEFTVAYITTAQGKLDAVALVINPKQQTAELKVITLRIYTNLSKIPSLMNKLERYAKKAGSALTILPEDFGIKEVRKKTRNGDVEGLNSALAFVLTNITNNLAALTAKGYTAAQKTQLETIKSELFADNAAQNSKVNARNNNVAANTVLFNDFWDVLTDISDGGKRWAKEHDKNKLDDYTIAAIKRRLRQEQKKTKVSGTVKVGGVLATDGEAILKPVLGGTVKKTKIKNGKYELKDLKLGDYILIMNAGGLSGTASVTITSSSVIVQDFDLVETP